MFAFFSGSSAELFAAMASCAIGEPDYDERAIKAVDQALSLRSPQDQKKIRLFMVILKWLPLFRYLRPFTKLSYEKRLKVMFRFANHPITKFRQGMWGLKTFALMGYYGTECSWSGLDYPGPVSPDTVILAKGASS